MCHVCVHSWHRSGVYIYNNVQSKDLKRQITLYATFEPLKEYMYVQGNWIFTFSHHYENELLLKLSNTRNKLYIGLFELHGTEILISHISQRKCCHFTAHISMTWHNTIIPADKIWIKLPRWYKSWRRYAQHLHIHANTKFPCVFRAKDTWITETKHLILVADSS